jgi:hypothetical protein
VNPRGPSEVTLGGVPLTARPPKPGEVTEDGTPLIWAALGETKIDGTTIKLANTVDAKNVCRTLL